ncbi:metal Ion transporter family [Endogone sp. FLAS-F59071]|nr:metal Ion transporter family [Endogone sp. FLAS-F59071]|eukprot:RUS18531.1 metal Ion transporter family [Endogone sp. FLAS-F59071]
MSALPSPTYPNDDVEAPFLPNSNPRISAEEDEAILGVREVHVIPEIDTGEVTEGYSWAKLWKYTGPGWLIFSPFTFPTLRSIAYLDPGNLESDLQAGAVAGYSLLWLLLWAHITGLAMQILAARLGVVTGKHLAQLIHARYPPLLSYLIWAFTELAIIGSDIQEIVGTAIALKIIFALPLWIGVLLTAGDTFTFMLLQQYGVRKLEAFFMVLIGTMAVCFWVEMFESKPDFGKVLEGIIVPNVPERAVVQAVAMLGAVIMPHNMYLHSNLIISSPPPSPRSPTATSALVMSRNLGPSPPVSKLREANFYFAIESGLALFISYLINLALVVCFAQVYFSPDLPDDTPLPGLYDAAEVLTRVLGPAAKYLWAAGLFAAGQSSTMTGTLAGQYVIEGFFGAIFKKQWHRVAITRAIALVPSMLVAVLAVERFDTMGELLNVLQSICLPTALIPILKLSASTAVMSVNFRISTVGAAACWVLAAITTGFNVYLFLSFLEELPAKWIGIIVGMMYLLFLAYLVYVPVREEEGSDGWRILEEGAEGEEEGEEREVNEREAERDGLVGRDEAVVDTTRE